MTNKRFNVRKHSKIPGLYVIIDDKKNNKPIPIISHSDFNHLEEMASKFEDNPELCEKYWKMADRNKTRMMKKQSY